MKKVELDEVAAVICRYYNYTLFDIFQKRWRDGGLTFGQIEVLYDHIQSQLSDEIKFMASIHGFSTKGDGKHNSEIKDKQNTDNEAPIFGDPDSYNHLSQTEKEELTQKMMKRHMNSGILRKYR